MAAVKSNILDDLAAFVLTTTDVPYQELGAKAKEAGWVWRLRQIEIGRTEAGLLVTFEVLIGKSYAALELVDQLTVQVDHRTPAVSASARMAVDASLIFLVFGRLPPRPPEEQPAEQPAKQPINGAAPVEVPIPDEDVAIDWKEGLPSATPAAEPARESAGKLEIVAGQTADGLPLLADLYAIGAEKEDIIDAVIALFEEVVPKIDSAAGLNALFMKNGAMMEFFKDLGTAEDRAALKFIADKRKEELRAAAPPEPPLRRSGYRGN